jgi:hypothetical protein
VDLQPRSADTVKEPDNQGRFVVLSNVRDHIHGSLGTRYGDREAGGALEESSKLPLTIWRDQGELAFPHEFS